MHPFEFHRPKSVQEAVAALKGARDGKLLAGGQSLIPVLKHDLAQPTALIAIREIEGLSEIRLDGNAVEIGAACTHAAVAGSTTVRDNIPALAELAGRIGDPQVRNRGTIGGAVAHADPAADYPAALVGLAATIQTDRRAIEADDFFTGLFATALEDDEVITAVRFPKPEAAAYAKFASPASKYALVGVMVARTAGTVRVAVTGAGSHVFRVSEMEAALASSFSPASIASLRVPADELNNDVEADAVYRAHLVNVMARRAVEAAQA